MPRRIASLAVWATLCFPGWLLSAPPSWTYLYPAGGQRGTTVSVKAAGSFERWPVEAWASSPAIHVKAESDKGTFAVRIDVDAPPGLHWLRCHDEQGASTLRPFLVGNLPEILEKEPNDDARKPHVLDKAAVVVNGRLGSTGDVDCFSILLDKGQTLVAAVEANKPLGSPMDSVLQVLGPTGFVEATNNDAPDLDPRIVYTSREKGPHVVRLFAFPSTPDSSIRFAGAETFVYRLTLTAAGCLDYAYPLAVKRGQPGEVVAEGWNIPEAARKLAVPADDGAETILAHPLLARFAKVRREPHVCLIERKPDDGAKAQLIEWPCTISGRIDRPGEIDRFRFAAKKGQNLHLQVESRSLGFPLDPVLRVLGQDGKQLAEMDDVGGGRRRGGGEGESRDPDMPFTSSADGEFIVEIRDLHGTGGPRHAYRLRVTVPEPDFELVADADRWAVAPGKPLQIKVTVTAKNGFKDPVEVALEGLPEGVAKVKSTPGKDSARLEVTVDKGPLSLPVRIVGKSGDKTRQAQFPLPGLGASTNQFWLTVRKGS